MITRLQRSGARTMQGGSRVSVRDLRRRKELRRRSKLNKVAVHQRNTCNNEYF